MCLRAPCPIKRRIHLFSPRHADYSGGIWHPLALSPKGHLYSIGDDHLGTQNKNFPGCNRWVCLYKALSLATHVDDGQSIYPPLDPLFRKSVFSIREEVRPTFLHRHAPVRSVHLLAL